MSESKSKSFGESVKSDDSSESKMAHKISSEFAAGCEDLLEQSMVKIAHCLEQLDDAQIWWRPATPLNSIGNLILHLGGNLRQWAISGVGDQPDKRTRQAEFDQRGVIGPKKLLELLQSTVDEAKSILRGIPADEWVRFRTIQGFEVSVMKAISHTVTHFVGHTHQIILLTRIQLGEKYRFQWTPESERTKLPI